jgi:isopenicillin-N N-acyltransferase like protein
VTAILHHRSAAQEPRDRGRELGAALEERIVATADVYRRLFGLRSAACGTDIVQMGAEAMEAITSWAPALGEEIEGIAAGCGLKVEVIAALNARTELLAAYGHAGHECSTAGCTARAAAAGRTVAGQTWDWLSELRDLWFVWTIEHPGGRVVHTLTEPGIVGKIGVSTGGVSVLLNILKHARDGRPIGTPVHVAARRVLDEAGSVDEALAILRSASPSASSCLTVADAELVVSAEVSPAGLGVVEPDAAGMLAHTNHFLTAPARDGDCEPGAYPDTLARLDAVRGAQAAREPGTLGADDLVAMLAAHGCGDDRVCMHPAADARFGESWETLATVVADPGAARLVVTRGGPRHTASAGRWDSADSTTAAPARHAASRHGVAAS